MCVLWLKVTLSLCPFYITMYLNCRISDLDRNNCPIQSCHRGSQTGNLVTVQNELRPLWLLTPKSGHVFSYGTEWHPYCVCGMNYECHCISMAGFWGISLQHLPRDSSMNTFTSLHRLKMIPRRLLAWVCLWLYRADGHATWSHITHTSSAHTQMLLGKNVAQFQEDLKP